MIFCLWDLSIGQIMRQSRQTKKIINTRQKYAAKVTEDMHNQNKASGYVRAAICDDISNEYDHYDTLKQHLSHALKPCSSYACLQ